MKLKLTMLMPVATMLCLVLVSCKKNDNLVSSPSSQLTPQLRNTTNLVDLGQDELNNQVSDMVGNNLMQSSDPTDCKVITYDPSKDVYPHTETVDFGSGCTDSLGKTISGKRIIKVYADWHTAPAGTRVSVITFSNYSVNGINISGKVTTTIGVPETAQHGATLNIRTTKTFTDDLGNTSTFIGEHNSKQIAGTSTDGKKDNVFQMTGISWGTEMSGDITLAIWKATIDQNNPVIKKADCSYRSQGGVNIKIYQMTGTDNEYLNYGDGTCDNQATLSIDGGASQDVTLPIVFYAAHL